MIGEFFASASLFVAGLLLFAAMVGARELGAFGHRVADRRHGSKSTTEGDANVLLSVALGLLSLLIGFAFSLSLSRYDHRRELVASEASAIATAAQRFGLIDSPAHDVLMRQLHDYSAARAAAGLSVDDDERRNLERKAEGLSVPLVKATVAAVLPLQGTSTGTFVLDGVDRAINLADQRRAAADAKLPNRVVEALAAYCVVVAGLFGYALTSTASTNRVATYLVFALFAFAIAIILDLDRPRGGAITIGQEPMADVLQKLTKQIATASANVVVQQSNPARKGGLTGIQ